MSWSQTNKQNQIKMRQRERHWMYDWKEQTKREELFQQIGFLFRINVRRASLCVSLRDKAIACWASLVFPIYVFLLFSIRSEPAPDGTFDFHISSVNLRSEWESAEVTFRLTHLLTSCSSRAPSLQDMFNLHHWQTEGPGSL